MSITKYVLLNWYSSMKKNEKDSDDLILYPPFENSTTPSHYIAHTQTVSVGAHFCACTRTKICEQ